VPLHDIIRFCQSCFGNANFMSVHSDVSKACCCFTGLDVIM
jgi:hypothetical protein